MADAPLSQESAGATESKLSLHSACLAFEDIGMEIEEAAALCYAASQGSDLDRYVANSFRALNTLLTGLARKAEAESERYIEASRAEKRGRNVTEFAPRH